MIPVTKKSVERPEHISILVPTRGRPEMLENMLRSIENTAVSKNQLDVWIYVDDDDVVTRDYIEKEFSKKSFSFKVYWHIGPRTLTQGEMTNALLAACTSQSGFYGTGTDDYIYCTKGWDEMVRQARNQFSDRMVLVHPVCKNLNPNQVTFSFMSAELIHALGYFYTEYFPFWFDDSWLDQIATMTQRKIRIDAMIEPVIEDKSHRLRNLIFWHSYYVNLLEERMAAVTRILIAAYGKDTPEFFKHLQIAENEHRKIIDHENQRAKIQHFHYEKRFAPEGIYEKRVLEIHHILQRKAIQRLTGIFFDALICFQMERAWKAFENILYGSFMLKPITILIWTEDRMKRTVLDVEDWLKRHKL